jgi:hypothetical protein
MLVFMRLSRGTGKLEHFLTAEPKGKGERCCEPPVEYFT